MDKRVFVLGIDGFPFSLINNNHIKKVMPYLHFLCEKYNAKQLESVYPVVSSVAWTSFFTGSNPGEHNIYGFTDRICNPFKVTITTSKDRQKTPIWNTLNTKKKKIIINVPLTYPPEQINGYMVSCFLCPNINNASFPKNFNNYLKEKEYIIDVDARLVQNNPNEFLNQLIKAMSKRFEIANKLLIEDWDYFQLHIMETDRLFHFFWDYISKKKNDGLDCLIETFFRQLDKNICFLMNSLISNSAIIIISDHGFCSIKEETQLNKWLQNNDYLKLSNEKSLNNYNKNTICYALTPGRIYFNLKNREEKGIISSNYNDLRQEIKNKLEKWYHPVTGDKIIDKVFFKEEIYKGKYTNNSPDIIVHPHRGYDLKSDLNCEGLFTKSALNGMHTYDDALILGINIDITKIKKIDEVFHIIKDYIKNEII